MRKIISIVLAFTLCLSISTVFCFADNSNELPEIDLGSGSISDNSSQNTPGNSNNNNNNSNNSSNNNADDFPPNFDEVVTDVIVNEPITEVKDNIDKDNTTTSSSTDSGNTSSNNSDKTGANTESTDDNNNTNTGDSTNSGNNNASTNDSNTDSNSDSNTDSNTNSNSASNTDSSTNSNTDNNKYNNTESNNNNAGNPTSPSSSSEPASSSQEQSSISYSDVEANKWYASDVAKATELGLINGYDGKFYPDNNLTYSEAIKLAACMHQLKTIGKVTLINGTKNWYDTYVEYAKQNKIITKDYEWTANATRAGYVEIFAHALPNEALSAKNNVADGVIPDVDMSDYAAAEIYKLYRAGVLTGSDSIGTFNPESNIRRSEVAAILTRMMDESARKQISLG